MCFCSSGTIQGKRSASMVDASSMPRGYSTRRRHRLGTMQHGNLHGHPSRLQGGICVEERRCLRRWDSTKQSTSRVLDMLWPNETSKNLRINAPFLALLRKSRGPPRCVFVSEENVFVHSCWLSACGFLSLVKSLEAPCTLLLKKKRLEVPSRIRRPSFFSGYPSCTAGCPSRRVRRRLVAVSHAVCHRAQGKAKCMQGSLVS